MAPTAVRLSRQVLEGVSLGISLSSGLTGGQETAREALRLRPAMRKGMKDGADIEVVRAGKMGQIMLWGHLPASPML